MRIITDISPNCMRDTETAHAPKEEARKSRTTCWWTLTMISTSNLAWQAQIAPLNGVLLSLQWNGDSADN